MPSAVPDGPAPPPPSRSRSARGRRPPPAHSCTPKALTASSSPNPARMTTADTRSPAAQPCKKPRAQHSERWARQAPPSGAPPQRGGSR
eukprot:3107719-Pyramimonas_sp.AAC.1